MGKAGKAKNAMRTSKSKHSDVSKGKTNRIRRPKGHVRRSRVSETFVRRLLARASSHDAIFFLKKPQRQKGAGTVATSRGQVFHSGVKMEEWQRNPKQVLFELCQSAKRPRPRWSRVRRPVRGHQGSNASDASQHNSKFRCRVVLPDPKNKRERDLVFTSAQSFASENEAQHMVSLLAIHHLSATRPHERRLPEPYKSAWLHLIKSKSSGRIDGKNNGMNVKETRQERKERERRERELRSKRRQEYAVLRTAAIARGDTPPTMETFLKTVGDATVASTDNKSVPKPPVSKRIRPASNEVVVEEVDDAGRPKQRCFHFFQHGECRFGDQCRFSHGKRVITNKETSVLNPDVRGDSSDVVVSSVGRFVSAVDRRRAREASQQKRAAARRKREMLKRRHRLPRVIMSEKRRMHVENIVRAVRATWNAELDVGNRALSFSTVFKSCSDRQRDILSTLQSNGFSKSIVLRALEEAWKSKIRQTSINNSSDKSKSNDAERTTLLRNVSIDDVMDWLMIYCAEEELPEKFNPKRLAFRVEAPQDSPDIAPNATINVASPSARQLATYGFCSDKAEQVLQRVDRNIDRALFVLYEDAFVSPTDPCAMDMSAFSDDDDDDDDESFESMVADEIEALESIYDKDVHVVTSTKTTITPPSTPSCVPWIRVTLSDATGVRGVTEVVVLRRRPGHERYGTYPTHVPWVLVRNESLSPDDLNTANTALRQHILRSVETSDCTLFAICSWVQEDLEDVLKAKMFGQNGRVSSHGALPSTTTTATLDNADDVRSNAKDESFFLADRATVTMPASINRKAFGSMISKTFRRKDRPSSGRNRRRRHDPKLSETLLAEDRAKSDRRTHVAMQRSRSTLPMHGFRRTVIETIEGSQVSLISGETGCGKTTQVPQFILEHYIRAGRGGKCSIVCTQPRRLAAVGVAERVAEERSETCGDVVGYSIRGETKSSSRTRLMFCTTGILLRRMQCSGIDDITHVLVDEVHERGVDTDFLLCLLKDLVRVRKKSLRVVLMSATLDADRFVSYFGGADLCPSVKVPGRTFPVKDFYLDDVWRVTKHVPRVSSREDDGRDNVQRALDAYDPKKALRAGIDYDAIVRLVVSLCGSGHETGAILIFMPGVGEITRLVSQLRNATNGHSAWVLPLHGSLPSAEQRKVFSKPHIAGQRKIVVSTNIAETSITIDDVVYVIDSGRLKEMQFDATTNMPKLVETWVSRASADQRKGRAGRVRRGFCYRMYPRHTFEKTFNAYQTPEIRRVPLERLCLQIKILEIGRVREFLGRAIDPPDARAITTAMNLLHEVQATTPVVKRTSSSSSTSSVSGQRKGRSGGRGFRLTSLGHYLAALPVDVRVGKALIYGAMLRCVEPIITIAALMSGRSPFLSPPNKRDEARAAQKRFVTSRSDHLTMMRAYHEWAASSNRRRFCAEHFLRYESLANVSMLRKQFARDIAQLGLLPRGCNARDALSLDSVANANASKAPLIKSALCAGLYANVMKAVNPEQRYAEVHGGTVTVDPKAKEIRFFCQEQRLDASEPIPTIPRQRVFVHPASVNFHERSFPWTYLIFHQKVQTSRVFVRDSTALPPFALLLCGGEINIDYPVSKAPSRRGDNDDRNRHGHIVQYGEISIGEWIRFEAPPRVAAIVKELRLLLSELLRRKIETPRLDISKSPLIEALIELLMSSGM